MQLFSPQILVETDASFQGFEEDYGAALRYAIDAIRDGHSYVVIYQDGELLHTMDELILTEKGLGEYFTDEDLVEEAHYAARKLEGDNAAWAS